LGATCGPSPQSRRPAPSTRPHTAIRATKYAARAAVPSWWCKYTIAVETHPLPVKAATALACTLAADGVAQLMIGAFDPWRALKLGLYAAFVSAMLLHHWHAWLDNTLDARVPGPAATAAKVALDQLCFSPLATVAFLSYVALAVQGGEAGLGPYLHANLVPTLAAGYAVWPMTNAVVFAWVPRDLRVLYLSVVGLFWGVFLSVSCVNGG
jgi:protein Mpv17